MKRISAILLSSLLITAAFSQEKTDKKGVLVWASFSNGDTMLYRSIDPVRIEDKRIFRNKKDEVRWNKLVRDVKKAYPYAVLAGLKFQEYEKVLASMPKDADKKKYMAKAEEDLKNQFEKDLRNLTVNQGKILIKLIDRETGHTSYDLVKELRGSFSAFMWQSVARLFGSSLKYEYDANGDDKMIEQIIGQIEDGSV